MSAPRFPLGAAVRIRRAWPPGHVRAPWYLRGCAGVICHQVGEFGNPEEMAYGRYDGAKLMLYRVRFRQRDIWPDYKGPTRDTLDVEVYDNWLEPVEKEEAV